MQEGLDEEKVVLAVARKDRSHVHLVHGKSAPGLRGQIA